MWLGILASAALSMIYTKNGLKGCSPGKLVFGRDMILPIKHTVGWELIHHQNWAQIIKDNIIKTK